VYRKYWAQSNLKIVGVYSSKEAAEAKKDGMLSCYENAGEGDIMVGRTWGGEIDLVVRAADECVLDQYNLKDLFPMLLKSCSSQSTVYFYRKKFKSSSALKIPRIMCFLVYVFVICCNF
jgi:hypothetical protein